MIVTKFTFSSRSVSTIVGGLIFLVIITSAFAAFMVMMQTNTDFLRTQVEVSEQEMKKIQEQFVMGAAYDSSSNNRLCVSIRNTGATPLEMTDLWIVNRSSVDVYDANLFDIDLSDAFIPIGSTGQILENQILNLDQGVYDIKVVTSSGTTKTTELQVFSGTPDPRLNVTSFAYPINAASGQNVTLGMHVYNVANTTLVDVQPRLEPGVRPLGSVPDDSKWLLSKGTGTASSVLPKGTQIIQAGEELTLVIGYDEDINGEIKVGRPIPVVIKTGSGAVFTKQITNGLSAG